MTWDAHNYSRIAGALLALTAACGSGRPAPASKFGSGIRMQDPAELDSENGLLAISLDMACLSVDATAPAPTDPTLTPTDPTLPPPDPTLPPADPTLPPPDPTLPDPLAPAPDTTSLCGASMNGMPPNLLGVTGLRPGAFDDAK